MHRYLLARLVTSPPLCIVGLLGVKLFGQKVFARVAQTEQQLDRLDSEQLKQVQVLFARILKAEKICPFWASCLTRALLFNQVLKLLQIRSRLAIGVQTAKMEDFTAHAWLVVLDSEGQEVCFDARPDQPAEYREMKR